MTIISNDERKNTKYSLKNRASRTPCSKSIKSINNTPSKYILKYIIPPSANIVDT